MFLVPIEGFLGSNKLCSLFWAVECFSLSVNTENGTQRGMASWAPGDSLLRSTRTKSNLLIWEGGKAGSGCRLSWIKKRWVSLIISTGVGLVVNKGLPGNYSESYKLRLPEDSSTLVDGKGLPPENSVISTTLDMYPEQLRGPCPEKEGARHLDYRSM